MKPFHILVGLGLVLIIGVAGWYMYMTKVPNFPKTDSRAIDLPTPKKGEPAKDAEGKPEKGAVKPEGAVPAPGAAPAVPPTTPAPGAAPAVPPTPAPGAAPAVPPTPAPAAP